ncbi:MAG: response regulator [Dehalococcoidales bacterium]|nr:response regulator [Dehalococcoidales bacterium]
MKRKKILITDDEENIRLLVSSMLGKDYVVLGASDGREAVDMARSQQPDLILMDILMPKMDGYTACNTIKKDPVTRAIPVVMLSAIDHELNVKLSQEMGASGYITKPFTPQDLLDTVDRFLKSPK